MNAALMHAATNLSQNPPNPEPHPTRCNAGYMPVVAARTWHYTAMSTATFAFSALMGYIATEAICKRVRSRN